MSTSRAMVLTRPGLLEARTFTLPEAGSAGGVIRVDRCGLCGTDIDLFSGGHEIPAPIIPGHEPVGTIIDIGEEAARNWGCGVGDRVVVESPIPCLRCRMCRRGLPRQCPRQLMVGFTSIGVPPALFGGYSEFMYLHPNAGVHKISNHVPLDHAAMFNTLAGAFEWTVNVGHVGPGQNVVVLGSGQRGMACGMVAKAAGAAVVAITGRSRSRDVKFPTALALGIDVAIDSEQEDVRARVHEITNGDLADVVINLVPNDPQAVCLAVELTRPGGRVVLSAMNSGQGAEGLSLDDIALKEISLIGVRGKSSSAFDQSVRFLESARFPLEAFNPTSYALDQAARAIDNLAHNEGASLSVNIAP
jgi:threonine dehydrogenase-like Zn-dependent dehydrogenase